MRNYKQRLLGKEGREKLKTIFLLFYPLRLPKGRLVQGD